MLNTVMQSVLSRREMLAEWARHDAATYMALTETLQRHGMDVRGAHVLDLGCGANAPMTLMLHSAGVRVVGADAELGYRWGLGFRLERYVSYLEEAGALRTLRKLAGEIVYDRVYYSTLASTLRLRLNEDGVRLRQMPANQLNFADGSFDVVHSNATWEHLLDVATVNSEVSRILAPGGLAYIEIHLFPSLSGGHDLPWIVPGRTDLGGVMPWGHLRNPNWHAPGVPLNRLRERDYRRLFRETTGLSIVEWRTEFTEGEELLTEDILRELPDYSRDELTRRSIIVVLRKDSVH